MYENISSKVFLFTGTMRKLHCLSWYATIHSFQSSTTTNWASWVIHKVNKGLIIDCKGQEKGGTAGNNEFCKRLDKTCKNKADSLAWQTQPLARRSHNEQTIPLLIFPSSESLYGFPVEQKRTMSYGSLDKLTGSGPTSTPNGLLQFSRAWRNRKADM